MSETPTILVFAGSAREASYNKQLARMAAAAVERAGGEATFLDLRDYPLPLYDGDLESRDGLPENAVKLKELFRSHEGLFIASPEYNSSFTPLLKNTLDWVSRRGGDPSEPPLSAYRGKVAAIVSASPGRLGGMRALNHLRQVLQAMQVLVLPDTISVFSANEAIAAVAAGLKDPKQQQTLEAIAARLVAVTARLNGMVEAR